MHPLYLIMKLLILLYLTICGQSLSAQRDSLTYYFKNPGWTITIPADFKIMDSATRAANMAIGKAAVEKTTDLIINTSKLKDLITITKGKLNVFSSNLTLSTIITNENWETADKSAKEIFLNSFLKQLPDTKTDTINSIVTIGNIHFKQFQATCVIKEKISLHIFYLSQYYKGHYFIISYFYADESAGEQIKNMLNNSKFDD